MQQKTCLITGANSGIGLAVATALADRGATTVLLCRDPERGAAARDQIRAHAGHDRVFWVTCDLSRLASVRAAAAAVLARWETIHVLINNAGTTVPTHQLTEDGVERTLAVNYLGHFLLTNLLLPCLIASAPARIVSLAGIYHRRGELDLDDLQHQRRPYTAAAANSASQLARVCATLELARRLEGTGVTANCVHPGAVLTRAQESAPAWARLLLHTVLRPAFVLPAQGARPVLALACDPEMEGVSGEFFRKMRRTPPAERARDPEQNRRLWEISEALCGITPAET